MGYSLDRRGRRRVEEDKTEAQEEKGIKKKKTYNEISRADCTAV